MFICQIKNIDEQRRNCHAGLPTSANLKQIINIHSYNI